MDRPTRRDVLVGSSSLFVASGAGTGAEGAEPREARARLKVLVSGGHPDDPESGCGGTIARYVDAGHEVVVLYLTRGEGGIKGKTHEQAAAIRSAEAEKACKILGARAVFAGQIDGATEVSPGRYDEFRNLIAAEAPDVVFTQWPVDTHPDHRACSLLTYDAWLKTGRKFALYYYEVDLGAQTQCFRPTDYVDVTATEPRKREACYAHESQNPAKGFYGTHHEPMLRLRGMESGTKMAEAFVRHEQGAVGRLPS